MYGFGSFNLFVHANDVILNDENNNFDLTCILNVAGVISDVRAVDFPSEDFLCSKLGNKVAHNIGGSRYCTRFRRIVAGNLDFRRTYWLKLEGNKKYLTNNSLDVLSTDFL